MNMYTSARTVQRTVVLGQQQARNMATLKDIKARLTSVQGIQKITASMKMVSAAKFSRAEKALAVGRPFMAGPKAVVEQSGLEVTSDKGKLIVALSSDRGLCGGCHSYISKTCRPMLDEDPEAKLVIVGDKVRGQLSRNYGKQMVFAVTDAGKKPPSFDEATAVINAINQHVPNWTKGVLVYNTFVSAIQYNQTKTPIFSTGEMESAMSKYEIEDEDWLAYNEFFLASTMYGAMLEAKASEESARMSAMENATNNAGDMIESLALLYNRTRQAVITNELIEIISGAAAV